MHRSGSGLRRPCQVRAGRTHVVIAEKPPPPRVANRVNNSPLVESAQRSLRARNLACGLCNALRFISEFHLALSRVIVVSRFYQMLP